MKWYDRHFNTLMLIAAGIIALFALGCWAALIWWLKT